MRILICIITTWLLLVAPVSAEHEVDHRYNIRGYVLDENQRAISNQEILVLDGSNLLAKSSTDSAGYFSLHLHLHNEDRGRKLTLRSGLNAAELRVSFDISDVTTLRVHDANFVGSEYIEGDLGRFRLPGWVYPLGGFIVIAFILVILEKRRKKKIRQHQKRPIEESSSHRQKRNKRKRRKH